MKVKLNVRHNALTDEWLVTHQIDGKMSEDRKYYTDNWADASGTMISEANWYCQTYKMKVVRRTKTSIELEPDVS